MSIPKQLQLTDKSKLWYGKHKGEALEDIPASYLLWIYENFNEDEPRNERLFDYINRNYRHLMQEAATEEEDE